MHTLLLKGICLPVLASILLKADGTLGQINAAGFFGSLTSESANI